MPPSSTNTTGSTIDSSGWRVLQRVERQVAALRPRRGRRRGRRPARARTRAGTARPASRTTTNRNTSSRTLPKPFQAITPLVTNSATRPGRSALGRNAARGTPSDQRRRGRRAPSLARRQQAHPVLHPVVLDEDDASRRRRRRGRARSGRSSDSASDWLPNVSVGPSTGLPVRVLVPPAPRHRFGSLARTIGSTSASLDRGRTGPRRHAPRGRKVRACPLTGGRPFSCSAGSGPASPSSPSRWSATAGAVRYVATGAAAREDDPAWDAPARGAPGPPAGRRGRPRRSATIRYGCWSCSPPPSPSETLLVDDLGGWVTALLDPARQPADDRRRSPTWPRRSASSAARLVLVSPEVGLSVVPLTPLGRAFADALGTHEPGGRRRLRRGRAGRRRAADLAQGAGGAAAPARTPRARGAGRARRPGRAAEPRVPRRLVDPTPAVSPEVLAPPAPAAATEPADEPGPATPDRAHHDASGAGQRPGHPARHGTADARRVRAAAGPRPAGHPRLRRRRPRRASTGSSRSPPAPRAAPCPRRGRPPRVVLLRGDHAGGAAAGALAGESAAPRRPGPRRRRPARPARRGGRRDAPGRRRPGRRRDGGAARRSTDDAVDAALRYGWRLAEEAADAGVDVLVLGRVRRRRGGRRRGGRWPSPPAPSRPRCSAGSSRRGAEVDDNAWMIRCAAVRDALHRIRRPPRGAARTCWPRSAAATSRWRPACSSARPSRRHAGADRRAGRRRGRAGHPRPRPAQARHWCCCPTTATHPTVKLGRRRARPDARCWTCGSASARAAPRWPRCRCCAPRSRWPPTSPSTRCSPPTRTSPSWTTRTRTTTRTRRRRRAFGRDRRAGGGGRPRCLSAAGRTGSGSR